MTIKNLLLLLFILFSFTSFNQIDSTNNKNFPDFKPNTISIELLGEGGIYSFNFDHLMNNQKKVFNSYTVGTCLFFVPNLYGTNFIFTPHFSYNFITGHKNNHFQFGAGISSFFCNRSNAESHYSFMDDNGTKIYTDFFGRQFLYSQFISANIGYRYQKPEGGFFYKIAFTPSICLLIFEGKIYGKEFTDPRSRLSGINKTGLPLVLPWGGMSFGYTLKN